jgi:hypothetical protein
MYHIQYGCVVAYRNEERGGHNRVRVGLKNLKIMGALWVQNL